MKFSVKYTEHPHLPELKRPIKEIVFEVADLETCKNAVAQWQHNERRLNQRHITIASIAPLEAYEEEMLK
jgi:hypothetical protein